MTFADWLSPLNLATFYMIIVLVVFVVTRAIVRMIGGDL